MQESEASDFFTRQPNHEKDRFEIQYITFNYIHSILMIFICGCGKRVWHAPDLNLQLSYSSLMKHISLV